MCETGGTATEVRRGTSSQPLVARENSVTRAVPVTGLRDILPPVGGARVQRTGEYAHVAVRMMDVSFSSTPAAGAAAASVAGLT